FRLSFVCSCFFFFQAEDGIRDPLVTGVQTCALPICAVSAAELQAPWWRFDHGNGDRGRCRPRGIDVDAGLHARKITGRAEPALRSEERRVGKEWRWRWAAED